MRDSDGPTDTNRDIVGAKNMLREDGQEIERGDGTGLRCSEVGRILCRSVSTQLCHNLRERGRASAGHSSLSPAPKCSDVDNGSE